MLLVLYWCVQWFAAGVLDLQDYIHCCAEGRTLPFPDTDQQ
jgi:hypothetical protein